MMLAQNFKTPADLNLSDGQYRAAICLLGMFERGEISDREFDMRDWCGTACCIWGHLNLIAKDAFGSPGDFMNHPMNDLFLPHVCELGDHPLRDIKPVHAAIALRNFLTRGEPRWEEALA